MLGRIIGRILQILGVIELPTELKLWWNVLSALIPAVAAGIFAYAQQASLPMLALLVLGVYVVFFLASIPVTTAISRLRSRERRQSEVAQSESVARVPTVHTGSTGSIGHVENLHIFAAPNKVNPKRNPASN
jgi:hypothetical protein